MACHPFVLHIPGMYPRLLREKVHLFLTFTSIKGVALPGKSLNRKGKSGLHNHHLHPRMRRLQHLLVHHGLHLTREQDGCVNYYLVYQVIALLFHWNLHLINCRHYPFQWVEVEARVSWSGVIKMLRPWTDDFTTEHDIAGSVGTTCINLGSFTTVLRLHHLWL